MAKMKTNPKPLGRQFKRAMVFGTFDQLHSGHRSYISLGFELAQQIEIFVMSDEASQPTKIYTPHKFEKRCQQIVEFANNNNWPANRYKILTWYERPELYKRMVQRPLLDLVITGHEYLDRTYEMFQRRLDLGLPQFTIVLKPRTRTKGKEITSTSIRLGI